MDLKRFLPRPARRWADRNGSDALPMVVLEGATRRFSIWSTCRQIVPVHDWGRPGRAEGTRNIDGTWNGCTLRPFSVSYSHYHPKNLALLRRVSTLRRNYLIAGNKTVARTIDINCPIIRLRNGSGDLCKYGFPSEKGSELIYRNLDACCFFDAYLRGACLLKRAMIYTRYMFIKRAARALAADGPREIDVYRPCV